MKDRVVGTTVVLLFLIAGLFAPSRIFPNTAVFVAYIIVLLLCVLLQVVLLVYRLGLRQYNSGTPNHLGDVA